MFPNDKKTRFGLPGPSQSFSNVSVVQSPFGRPLGNSSMFNNKQNNQSFPQFNFNQQSLRPNPPHSVSNINLFNQQSSSTPFGNAPAQNFGFGAFSSLGTTTQYAPTYSNDTVMQKGMSCNVKTKIHSIVTMPEYNQKSQEELRWEDYQSNRKGQQSSPVFTPNKPTFEQPQHLKSFGRPVSVFGTTSAKPPGFGNSSFFNNSNTPEKSFGNQFGQHLMASANAATTTAAGAPAIFGNMGGFGHATTSPINSAANKRFYSGFLQHNANAQPNAVQPKPFTFPTFAPATKPESAPLPMFGRTDPTPGFSVAKTEAPPVNFQSNSSPATAHFGFFSSPPVPPSGLSWSQTAMSTPIKDNSCTTASSLFSPNQQSALSPVMSFECQTPDYHTIVQQIYETLPYRAIFDGVEVKTSYNDSTNPVALRQIINNVPQNVEQYKNKGTEASARSYYFKSYRPEQINQPPYVYINKSFQKQLLDIPGDTLIRRPIKQFVLPKATRPISFKQIDLVNPPIDVSSAPESSTEVDSFKSTAEVVLSPEITTQAATEVVQVNGSQVVEEMQKKAKSRSLNVFSMKKPPTEAMPAKLGDSPEENTAILARTSESDLKITEVWNLLQERNSLESLNNKECGDVLEHRVETEIAETGENKRAQTSKDEKSDKSEGSSTPSCSSRISFDEEPTLPLCGVKLTRQDYYTIPPVDKIPFENGASIVRGFTIGRKAYGNIYFPEAIDVANMDLDDLVHFERREVVVYPDDAKKPPPGQGLNRPAQITLDGVWPRDSATQELIKDPEQIHAQNFLERLDLLSKKQDATMVDYRPETGSWVFTVQHLSRYGYDSDEENADGQDKAQGDVAERNGERLQRDNTHSGKENRESRDKKDMKEAESRHAILKKDEEGLKIMESKHDIFKTPSGNLESINITDLQFEKLESQRSIMTKNKEVSDGEIESIKRTDKSLNLKTVAASIDAKQLLNKTSTYEFVIKQDSERLKNIEREDSHERLRIRESKINVETADPIHVDRLHFETPFLQRTSRDSKAHMLMKRLFFGSEDEENGEALTSRRAAKTPVVKMLKCAPKYYPLLTVREVRVLKAPGIYMDMSVFKGKSFKVGWSSRFQMVALESFHTVKILQVDGSDAQKKTASLEGYLCMIFKNSNVVVDSILPTFTVNKNRQTLLQCQETEEALSKPGELSLYSQVWGLCLALWGPSATTPSARRDLFSRWLEEVTLHYMNRDLDRSTRASIRNVFVYMTGHKLQEAAALAGQLGLHNLSLLMSTTNHGASQLVAHQLNQWRASGAINYINRDLIKIYMLLAGCVRFSEINACEGLDWKRSMGIYFWYTNPDGVSLIRAVEDYRSDFLNGFTRVPCPEWSFEICDVLFQLIVLFINGTYSLDKVVNPPTHTENLMDYQLSWLLLLTLESLEVGHAAEHLKCFCCMNLSAQLENLGLWKWSIFVLLFSKDPSSKTNSILDILDRNLDPDDYATLDSLVTDFRLPPKWLHLTIASRCALVQSYKHFILAEDWFAAHQLAVDHLIPDLLTSGQSKALFRLLKFLAREVVQNSRAGTVLDFLVVQQKVLGSEWITDAERDGITADVVRLCQQLKSFPLGSNMEKVVVAELSKFVAKLLHALFPADAMLMINVITELVMPPDYKFKELQKYVTSYLDAS